NLTKIWKKHQFKTGLQYEKVHYLFEQSGPNDVFAGKFDFSFNSANTVNNTTYPYANALLGYFNSYTESTNRTQYSPVTPILEFYLQDTWKLSPRFTVDLQQYQSNNLSSSFVPSLYDPSKAPLIYRPVLVGSTRMAYDPRNPNVVLPGALIGQIVPGTGDKKNGIVKAGDPGYPRALVDFQGILPAPRIGFAWDMFGDNTTALRGGFATTLIRATGRESRAISSPTPRSFISLPSSMETPRIIGITPATEPTHRRHSPIRS